MAKGTTSTAGKSKAGTKRTAKSKTSSRKKSAGARRGKQEQGISNDLKYEIIVLLFAALSLLMIITVYFNKGGKVGEMVRYLMFGTFGISAYLLPVYILGASFLKIFNKDNARLNNKLSLVFIGVIMAAVFAHMTYIEDAQINKEILDQGTFFASSALYFQTSAKTHLAGGMAGGVIGDFMEILIGRIGSFIILIMIFLSLIILITEQSIAKVGRLLLGILKWMGHKFRLMVMSLSSKVSDHYARYKKEKEERESIMMTGEIVEREVVVRQQPLKKARNFLERVTMGVSEEAPVEKVKEVVKTIDDEKVSEKPLRKKPKKTYKINGMDPFKQIEEQEEKERAQKHAVSTMSAKELMTSQVVQPEDEASKKAEKPVAVEAIQTEIETGAETIVYKLPPIELMKMPSGGGATVSMEDIEQKADKLVQTLESFGVGAKVIDVSVGPTVTRYELQPDIGVKVSKIVNLQDDIALNLAASGIRIEAPIPGKSAVGIEVPNQETKSVLLREVIDTPEFKKFPSKIAFALGKDIGGKTIIADIARMPHMLVAGATGSGKSVCVNTLITSILYRSSPDDVKLLMIDPKVVELSAYNGIPHLLIPVVTEAKKAAGALNWAVQEMTDRYKLFAAANVRDLKGYNEAVIEHGEGKKLPQIVIIVDELADLMMVAPNDVEDAICRLAQMARAAGLHLIIATQRPSVDVITGLIKANIPSRIAFNVSSGIDSRTIIDTVGAEKLLGKGDMLFYPVGMQKPIRVQGAFVSEKEVEHIVTYLKDQHKANYSEKIMNQISKSGDGGDSTSANGASNDFDALFNDALELVIDKQKASASMIQRRFRVGYNRAARILDQLYDAGFVGDEEGSKPRKVLMTRDEYAAMKDEAESKEAESDRAGV